MQVTRFALAVLCIALSGCAAISGGVEKPDIRVPAALADVALPAPIPVAQLMVMSPALEAFVERTVANAGTDRQRVINLERTVNHPGGLAIAYDPGATLSVNETFRQQRGNCLSLSLMFAAMVRSLGIDARFQEVEIEPYWREQNGVVFSQRHINVVGDLRRERYILDFYEAQPGQKLRPMRVMADQEAFAHYYNNRAALALAKGDSAQAFSQFRRALELGPNVSWIWSNFAVLYKRLNEPAPAIQMLRYALQLDPGNTAAMATLAVLLRDRGEHAEAERLSKKAQSAREKNPYYWFSVAEKLAATEHIEQALAALDKAIKRGPREPVFYQLALQLAKSRGFAAHAERLEKQARRRGVKLD